MANSLPLKTRNNNNQGSRLRFSDHRWAHFLRSFADVAKTHPKELPSPRIDMLNTDI